MTLPRRSRGSLRRIGKRSPSRIVATRQDLSGEMKSLDQDDSVNSYNVMRTLSAQPGLTPMLK